MRAEFAAAAEARKRAGEEEEGGPAKRSKAEPLSDAVLEVLNQVSQGLLGFWRRFPAGFCYTAPGPC